MQYCDVTFPKHCETPVSLPSSKSICNRALIVSALAGGSRVHNVSDCDDTHAVEKALSFDASVVDIGAAGTAMRFLTAYYAGSVGRRVVITGSERMKNRPIAILVSALNSIGGDVRYVEKEGFPPLEINGKKLVGGELEIDPTVSSQYLSALLMIAPLMENGLRLKFSGKPASRPYIEMTMDVMASFGVRSEWRGNEVYVPRQKYEPADYTVEGDWSAASYWFEIASLSPVGTTYFLKTLRKDSIQGDSCILRMFEPLGVRGEFVPDGLRLVKTSEMTDRLAYDFSDCPDLAQTFVAACCLSGIGFEFSGLESLRIKETDRIAALQTECAKIGCDVEAGNGTLCFSGHRREISETPVFDTYEDHRMAMAFAPAAMIFERVRINEPSVVSKSYPGFWDDLRGSGFEINFLAR